MLDDTVKNKIIENLRKMNPYKIIIFGSYAYGNPQKYSDIDLLVVTSDDFIPQNYADMMRIKLNVAKAIEEIRYKFPIDLIVHTKPMHKRFIELGSMFSKEILSRGIVLYERHNQGMA